jgi:hypothetical protein
MLKRVELQINGRAVFAKAIVMKVAGAMGPGPQNNISVNVHRSFYGTERVGLSQLIGYRPGVDMNAQVESVTIVSQGHGTISLAGAGQVHGTIRVIGGQGTSSIRVMNWASLSQLKLRVNGRITVKQLRIKLKPRYY